jgi:metal-sulfur cluster biosynthetic enzyme/nitrite reductase/ring-hydroxylating ferredoxin subunit
MSQPVRVAKLSDLPEGGRLLVELDDRIVVLVRVGDELFCLDDVCTHDGGPLSEGLVSDHTIACPRHGAKFDLRTGKALTMPATVDTAAHEVQVRGDEIYVRLCEVGELAHRPPARVPPTAAAATSSPAPRGSDATLEPAHAAAAKEASPPASQPTSDAVSAEPGGGPPLNEELVRETLKQVVDPELFVNIVDLGLVYNVDLIPAADGRTDIRIEMTMTSPMCPAGPQLIAHSKQVLSRLSGVGNVEVRIVLDPPWTPDKMTQEARDQLGIF